MTSASPTSTPNDDVVVGSQWRCDYNFEASGLGPVPVTPTLQIHMFSASDDVAQISSGMALYNYVCVC